MSFGPNQTIPIEQPSIYKKNIHKVEMKNFELMNEEAKRIKKRWKKKKYGKRKTCWHYLRGYCERGNSCYFKHSMTDAVHESQKVFLPGQPENTTEVLSHVGCNVINKAVNLHKCWSRVYPGSPDEARILFEKGRTSTSGHPVEERPWQAAAEKQRKRIADINRRSVFLGGLPTGVTWQMIRSGLAKYGAKVTNLMRVKQGFCPKVTLATVHQARMLVSAEKVEIKGSMVDVRPYHPKSSFNISE